MGESAYKLAIEIDANVKKFNSSMGDMKDEIKGVLGNVKGAINENSRFLGSFMNLAGGIGKFIGIAGGATAGIAFLKSAIESVEGPGDKFEEIIGGCKEALFEFKRDIATVDFRNFFSGLAEGYERGKKFAAMMDELADRSAYNDYIVANLRAQSVELQETIKNKQLDIAVRTEASNKREGIEKKILTRTQELAQKAFLIEKGNWERRNKMSTEEAIKIYETIDGLSADMLTKIQQGVQTFSGKTIKESVPGIPEETIQSYRDFIKLLDTGEKDVLIKLFNAYKNIDTIKAESQRTYNLAIRENSMLLDKQEKSAEDLLRTLKEVNGATEAGYKLSTITGKERGPAGLNLEKKSAGLINIKLPVIPEIKGSDKYDKVLFDITDRMTFLARMENPFDVLNSSLTELNASLIEGANNYKDYAKNIAAAAKQIIGAFIAEGVAAMVSNALKTSAKTGPLAIVLAPALAAAAGGIAKTAFNSLIPNFASGALAYGPTYAQVGEYPGARTNPEVIAPLNKLKGMVGGSLMEPRAVRLQVDVGGNMLAFIDCQQRKLNNYR
jgi:hypothetical protein